MIVRKFGGSSVADADRIAGVARIVAHAADGGVVVTSALGGTTDTLLQAGALAERGQVGEALEVAATIRRRHLDAAPADEAIRTALDARCDSLEALLRGVALLGEQTPRSRATLAAFGERLAVPLVAAAIAAEGRPAVAVDAADVLRTDARFHEATVDMAASRALAQQVLLPLVGEGTVPVVTGFFGATAEGHTALLGRGGSDFSAAILGALLDADEVEIWTDVDGILSADPRFVRDARVLERVSYREAAEMSYFGAKVVHPKTMSPVAPRGIPLRIRNTFRPELPGTRIGGDTAPTPEGVKTITAARALSLVTVEGPGLSGLPGVARRILEQAERVDVNVVMISQASSEQSVSLVVPDEGAGALALALESAFALERGAGLVDPIRVRSDVAVVSAVGEEMVGRVGVAARLFGALGASGVNVLAIAQGASELSISAAVFDAEVPRALRAVHAAFGLTRRVEVFVVGAGRVAGAFLPMWEATRRDLAESHKVDLVLVGMATRSRMVWRDEGLAASDALDALAAAGPRPDDAALVAAIEAARHGPLVLVDLTAGDLAALHRDALAAGLHVVTANKRPLSGPLAAWHELVDATSRTGASYGYETTFGAGLPVLHTLKELVHTGDAVHEVSGCFSGTLGFLATRLQDGASLAAAVQEASDLGYTEPDPREDLSGRDVARKALIVARAIGLELEPEDVSLDPFVPDLDDGLEAALAKHGGTLADRIQAAGTRGEVLRYVATITPEAVRVGLDAVPGDSAIGRLRGPDNILVFRTARYRDYPLVVQGPGAGAEVTAAGVLGDVIRIASGG